jgi:hypothetical protein
VFDTSRVDNPDFDLDVSFECLFFNVVHDELEDVRLIKLGFCEVIALFIGNQLTLLDLSLYKTENSCVSCIEKLWIRTSTVIGQ